MLKNKALSSTIATTAMVANDGKMREWVWRFFFVVQLDILPKVAYGMRVAQIAMELEF